MKFFAAPWPQLSPISAVDILLVAIIIYELLALIKADAVADCGAEALRRASEASQWDVVATLAHADGAAHLPLTAGPPRLPIAAEH